VSTDLVEYQLSRLKQYSILQDSFINLNTPTNYYSQRDNFTMPHRTCNSSANAMYLDWLRRITGRDPLGGDDGYLAKVLSFGDTIYHEMQTKAIKEYGFSTLWLAKGNNQIQRNVIGRLITSGIPVVVNILHRGKIEAPRGGHIILLCGWLSDTKEWLCQDPYGTLRSDYQDTNGRLSRISQKQFTARWQGGYRVLA
jgi:hypothetical protein